MKSSMIIHPEELSREWIDKLADAGVGVLGIHPRGGPIAAETLADLLEQMKSAEYRSLIDYAHSRGLTVEYEFHSLGYLLKRELFAEHPEYFRMNAEGERTADYNLCVSNPDALELLSKNAAEVANALYGSTRDFYFWLDDGHGLHCHCPSCKRLSASDQQLTVLNGMLREIRKSIPDARMAYLAYMDSIVPPAEVKPDEGIFLEYAPFEKYTAKGDDAPELIARESAMLIPLMKAFDHQPAKVLEYWYDNSMFSAWKKPPKEFKLDGETMRVDIAEYRKMGFDFVATFACFLGKDYEELYGAVDVSPFGEAVKD